eukprot:TRINITY_DN52143_c0_g1_i1.p1 TRINITY_DN52143_c0_g1~~TRINITY_DN52143_c0_g1_i1.p1  ORF type:complete len:438 (+),score=101.35 TRINITY_DN52143_c0_g1_i1:164-1477(+)
METIKVEEDASQRSSRQGKGLVFFGYSLFLVLGMFPFVLINALFSELPVFVRKCPEEKKVGSWIGASFQLANITAFAYIYIQHKRPIKDRFMVPGLIILGILSAIGLSVFWDSTIHSGSSEHSIWLFVFTFFSGVVGCTGVVVVFGHVSLFKKHYVSAISTGLGGSGLITAVLSLIQGGGSNSLRFSVGVFFIVMGSIMACSLVCYFVINSRKWKKKFAKKECLDEAEMDASISRSPSIDMGDIAGGNTDENVILLDGSATSTKTENVNAHPSMKEVFSLSSFMFVNVFCTGFMTYFLIPGIEPFLVDSDDDPILLWIANAFLVGNLFGRVITTWFVFPKVVLTNVSQFLLGAFLVVAALMSHTSFFSTIRISLVIVVFFFSALNGYTSTMVYFIAHRDCPPAIVDMASRWCSVFNQVGALTGTFVGLGCVELGFFS